MFESLICLLSSHYSWLISLLVWLSLFGEGGAGWLPALYLQYFPGASRGSLHNLVNGLHVAHCREMSLFSSLHSLSVLRILSWSHPFHTPSFTASCDVAVSRWCLFKASPRVSLVLGLVGWYVFYPMCPTSFFTYFGSLMQSMMPFT